MKRMIKIAVICAVMCSCNNPNTETNPITHVPKEDIRMGEISDTLSQKEVLASDLFFPEGFRSWKHVKSMVLQKGHPLFANFGGIHHIYANEKALEGYKNGSFPDGSVIVFDLLEAIEKDNAITEGNRKVTGVMYKNSSVFNETGGWVFGAYKNLSGEKLDLDWKAQCFSCHAARKEHDYVFSSYRE